MKNVFREKDEKGWTYYIDSRFAWIPTYCQGTFVWLRRVWFTWPEKEGKPILASDVFPDWFKDHGPDYNPEMYRAEYPYDPRDEKAQAQFLKENS